MPLTVAGPSARKKMPSNSSESVSRMRAVQVGGANHAHEMRGELHMIVEQALAAPLMVVLEPEVRDRRTCGLAWGVGTIRVDSGGDPLPLTKLHG